MLLLTSICLLLFACGGYGCEDVSPDVRLDCERLVLLAPKLCLEDFMIREALCDRSCGRPPCPAKTLYLERSHDVVFEAKKTGQAQKFPMEPSIHESRNQYPSSNPVPSDFVHTPPVALTENQDAIAQPEQVPVSSEFSEPYADEQTHEAPVSFLDMTEPMADGDGMFVVDTLMCESPAVFLGSREDLSLFRRAVQKFGLWSTFLSHHFFATVFVPNDEAFRRIFEILLISEEDFFNGKESTVLQLLQVHVVPGQNVLVEDMFQGQMLPTLLSTTQSLEIDGNQILSPGGPRATIIEKDITFCKTMMHVVDGVLVPAPVIEMQKSLRG